jgi:hypothetical protein
METVAIAAYISHLRSRTTFVPERVRSAWWRQAAGRFAFGGVHLAPGETGTRDTVFAAGRCDGRAGSALPPGNYGLRVVLTPEGPPEANLSRRLLSPETIINVTR